MSYTSTQYNDADLLLKMAQGDHKAFETLWVKYWNLVYNAVFKRLNDKEQSRDIVQELFIDLWERRTSVQIENLPAYLNKAARYQVFKLFANNKTNTRFLDVFDLLLERAVSSHSSSEDKELEKLAKLWLDSLPPKRKEIFILHYRENLSTSEIAEKLGVSQKTVQNQLGTASNELKRKLISMLVLLATS